MVDSQPQQLTDDQSSQDSNRIEEIYSDQAATFIKSGSMVHSEVQSMSNTEINNLEPEDDPNDCLYGLRSVKLAVW
jgi:hypothetical protein